MSAPHKSAEGGNEQREQQPQNVLSGLRFPAPFEIQLDDELHSYDPVAAQDAPSGGGPEPGEGEWVWVPSADEWQWVKKLPLDASAAAQDAAAGGGAETGDAEGASDGTSRMEVEKREPFPPLKPPTAPNEIDSITTRQPLHYKKKYWSAVHRYRRPLSPVLEESPGSASGQQSANCLF